MEEYANNIEVWFRDYLDEKYDEGQQIPLIDTYLDEIIEEHNINGRDKEEVGEIFNILSDMASFSSRLRIKVGDIYAEKVVTEMLDEADRESGE